MLLTLKPSEFSALASSRFWAEAEEFCKAARNSIIRFLYWDFLKAP